MTDSADQPWSVPQLLQQAIAFHQDGRLADAEALYRRILGVQPANVAARHHLGKLAVEVGMPAVGLPLLRSALESETGVPSHWVSYIDALLRAGQEEAARQVFDRALEVGIGGSEINRLGAFFSGPGPTELNALFTLFDQGRVADGEQAARRLTARHPRHGTGWKALAFFMYQQGRLDEAVGAARQGAALLPWDAEAQFNLGVLLNELGDVDGATASYQRALAVRQHYPEALNSLGLAQRQKAAWEDAEASFRKAIELRPDFIEALSNLGSLLCDRGRPTDAVQFYRSALRHRPDHAVIHVNLGIALRDTGHHTEALALFRRVSAMEPRDAVGYLNIALAYHHLGQMNEAHVNYRRAFAVESRKLQHAVSASFFLPCLTKSITDLDKARLRYQEATAALADMPGGVEITPDAEGSAYFLLSYHGRDNRRLIEGAAAALRRQIPTLRTAPAVKGSGLRPKPAEGRIRVGFLSQFFCDHTIGRLNLGFIRHLDRTRFEVVVLHTSKTRSDNFRKKFDECADRVVTLPADFDGQRETILRENLDLLHYADIGMTLTSYLLAHSRLAPVQSVGWGHPDTTGLDTIDYFLSSDLIEAPGAERYYSERLVRMRRLPCFYERPAGPGVMPTKAELNLPENATLYGCLQSLFKFHPEFDTVLNEIVKGDPSGLIVLIDDAKYGRGSLLRKRWQENVPDLLKRVVFLPSQPVDRYLALLNHMDLLLDPVHFGSGNSFYEAMIYGTPAVTWPGPFMRGRVISGCYRQMALSNAPVVADLKDYASMALEWGREPGRRQTFRSTAKAAADRALFADMEAVRELEDFFAAAIAAGRSSIN